MTVLDTAVDPRTPGYPEARNATLDRLDRLEAALEEARAGGGERAVTRHHARGKLLPRERIEMLLDQDAPFLELSPVSGWGTEFPVGAGVVTGVGVVEAVECMIIATDPTVEGTAANPYAVEKIRRAARIASADRLPLVNLVESAAESPGAGPPPGGSIARDLSRLSTRRVPTVCVVFGPTSGDTAYLPALADYTIMVRGHAKLLTHPRPRAAANGSDVRAAAAPADQLAEDERDAMRLARQCVRRLNWRKAGPPPRTFPPAEPKYDAEDLLALAGLSTLFDPREVLARLLDGSEFDEFKPAVGAALLAGWGELHGYPIGVLAAADVPPTAADTQKAVHFIQLANATDTSLLLLQRDETGTLGSPAVDALAHSTVPLLALNTGRTGDPRFAFSWPADGPAGGGDDDGVIDPRDTRTVLGLCLSAVHSAVVEGAGHGGAFRAGKVDQ
ncbi:carboxyl transferase domain-containing protein [Paractinoplanes lichenicola]|uniref:Acetyl-CoA carboxylase carboxyltransferase subunit n=1 Tax=Paractinoplanes lichenicola TaxID=2802976 RepID=A0ABS1W559_9ACTN|nr:carboxyl transferase domain-containing protein [Actinoplanes lichenicola]MBL7261871.1 acetyl-CoA carboxylase carboxyltransferase subunit [Actinoplanes lichenicola]